MYNSGEMSTNSTAKFDYETQNTYILEVTAFDGEFEDVQTLTVHISDVNEKPVFKNINRMGQILENELIPRVVLDLNAADPDKDVLTYDIIGSDPTAVSFSINASNGRPVTVLDRNRLTMSPCRITIHKFICNYINTCFYT